MAHLIDKDDVLAKVKNIKEDIGSDAFLSEYERGINLGKELVCDDIIYTLNTLEAKEVDMKKELEDFLEKNSDSNGFFNPLDIAKHFFELGLRCSQTDDSYIEGVKGSYTTTDKD